MFKGICTSLALVVLPLSASGQEGERQLGQLALEIVAFGEVREHAKAREEVLLRIMGNKLGIDMANDYRCERGPALRTALDEVRSNIGSNYRPLLQSGTFGEAMDKAFRIAANSLCDNTKDQIEDYNTYLEAAAYHRELVGRISEHVRALERQIFDALPSR